MPARIVGNIAAQLGLQTQAWTRGFKQARKDLKGFQATMASTAKKIARFAAGALAVRQLAATFNSTRRAIDSLAKTADRLGTSTTTLQAFDLAAKKSGSSMQEVRNALTQMTRTIGEAIKIGGEYEKSLNDIGLRGRDLVKLNLEQQFSAVASAISKLPTPAQRTAAAMKVFTESGSKMVTLLERGGDAIDDARKSIRRWGGELSKQGTDNVQQMNDILTELETRFTLLAAKGVVGLANAFNKLAKEIGATAKSGKELLEPSLLSKIFGSGRRKGDLMIDEGETIQDYGINIRDLDPDRGGFFAGMADKFIERLDNETREIREAFSAGVQDRVAQTQDLMSDAYANEIKMYRRMYEEKTRIEEEAERRRQQMLKDNKEESYNYLRGLTAGLAQESKAWFEIDKAWAIGEAIVNTNAAMSKALAWGPIAGPIMAGVIGAAGLAHVAAISSTTFEGGGTVANTGGGAAGAANAAAAEPQRVADITITGGPIFGRDQVIELGRTMAELAEDGVTFNVN